MKLQIFDFSVYGYNFTHVWDSLGISNVLGSLSSKDLEAIKSSSSPLVSRAILNILEMPPQNLESLFFASHWVLLFKNGNPEVPTKEPFWSLVVADSKPYWRSDEYPDYKAGRPPKPVTLSKCLEVGYKIIESLQIPFLKHPGYEADDLAALVVKFHQLSKYSSLSQWNQIDHLYLSTVDSDWMQLISDRVTWVNTGPWKPLVRDLPAAIEWIQKRLKVTLDHPQDIVPIKCIQGDKSDNLPPGTAPYMIDLANPPAKYNLMLNPDFMDQVASLEFPKEVSPQSALKASQSLHAIEGLSNVLKAYQGGLL